MATKPGDTRVTCTCSKPADLTWGSRVKKVGLDFGVGVGLGVRQVYDRAAEGHLEAIEQDLGVSRG